MVLPAPACMPLLCLYARVCPVHPSCMALWWRMEHDVERHDFVFWAIHCRCRLRDRAARGRQAAIVGAKQH